MKEQKLIQILTRACGSIVGRWNSYDDTQFENISFEYYEEDIPWLELYASKGEHDFDDTTLSAISDVFRSVCTQNHIIFIDRTKFQE